MGPASSEGRLTRTAIAAVAPAASLATFAHLTRRPRMTCGSPGWRGSPPAARPSLELSADLAREYELVLMLDPEAPDGRRDEVAGETQQRIESSGALKHADTWGTRKLAFEIRQRTEADYRFYRFEGGNELLEQLDHSLKITDGVLRFRIFKVDDGTPMIAPPPTAQPAGVSQRAARAEARRAAPQPAAEEAGEPEPAAEEPAEQPAEEPEPAPEPAAGEAAEAPARRPSPPRRRKRPRRAARARRRSRITRKLRAEPGPAERRGESDAGSRLRIETDSSN